MSNTVSILAIAISCIAIGLSRQANEARIEYTHKCEAAGVNMVINGQCVAVTMVDP